MKSDCSDSNIHIFDSVYTSREESEQAELARLDVLESSVDELQGLCALLQREKNECSAIRNQTAEIIRQYQLYQRTVESYIQQSGQSFSSQQARYYAVNAIADANDYLKSETVCGKPQKKKLKSPQQTEERSRVLKRLNKSIKSPITLNRY